MIEKDKKPTDPIFGELIYSYTRAQAIDDGVLIDVTETAKEAGIKFPTAVTSAVWETYVKVPEGVEGQDEKGRLWDILMTLKFGIARGKSGTNEIPFQYFVRNDDSGLHPQLVTLKAVCGPNDDASPCITIMMPNED